MRRFNFYANHAIGAYVQRILSALTDNPSIKELDLNISQSLDNVIPNLSGFKNLSSIRIKHRIYGNSIYLESSMMQPVAASPKLKSFEFSVIPSMGGRIYNRLDTVVDDLKIWIEQESSMPLEALKLVNIPMQLTVVLGRVFQNLKHLILRSVDRLVDDISWEGVWEALYDSGCNEHQWLATLVTNGVQPAVGMNALLKYLTFHPGLQALTICDPPIYKVVAREPQLSRLTLDEDEDSPRPLSIDHNTPQAQIDLRNNQNRLWANKLWGEIIPRSAHSLKVLKIQNSQYGLRRYRGDCHGPWSYGPTVSAALRQCTSLTVLYLSVSNVNSDWACDKAKNVEMLPLGPDSAPMTYSKACGRGAPTCLRPIIPRSWGMCINTVVSQHTKLQLPVIYTDNL